MRGIVVGCAMALFATSALGQSGSDRPSAYDRTTNEDEINWMDRGMADIAALFSDPEAVKFRNVYFARRFAPTTCGEVNGTDATGEYAGYQRFIAVGYGDLLHLESEIVFFDDEWADLC